MTTTTGTPTGLPTGAGAAQIADFREFCERVSGSSLTSPEALHAWSVESYRDFWATFLDWSGLAWEGSAERVCTSDDVEAAAFFPDVRLNYTENILRPLPGVDDDAPALTSVHADGAPEHFSRGRLRSVVQVTATALAGQGVGLGDRVAVVAPNHARTVVAALALAALGATTATATPDMGPTALVGRLEQVDPVLLIVDRTTMGGDAGADAALANLLASLPTVRRVLVLDDLPLAEFPGTTVDRLRELVAAAPATAGAPWPRLPFNHPLWVMFSSGTTGPPKAMVHGAGGSLLEHVKEHRLHGDLRPDDVLYFHTTTAWMMWNWQLSALAVGAHVVVYDGPIRGPETLWELVARHGVTVFGTSPAYLQMCQDVNYRPAAKVDLHRLRAVLSTGAVLHDWQFDWVQESVGEVPLQSISGGTDIIGCFVLGHPERPVVRGRCQSISLGLDVAALDDDGEPVFGQAGELVCRRPFPSRPTGFLRDPSGSRFHDAYFADHPGVWTHGDMIELTPNGSARMHGRSDGVLNIDGVRIGPAEIYRIVRSIPAIEDAMAVEQRTDGGARLVLLVVLRPGQVLDETLRALIRATLRREGSAAHVPQVIAAVDGLPTTHNGKRSERAARDAINGDPIRNLAALRNPDSLDAISAAVSAATQVVPASEADQPDMDGDVLMATVSRAFRDVLGVASVGPTTNFFDLGGTSRHSMTILRRLRHELRRPVSLDAFLAAPTVAGLADALRRADGPSSRFTLLRDGDPAEPRLYLVHGVYGDVDGYRAMIEYLTIPGAAYGIEAALTDDSGRPKTVPEIAAEHVAELGTFQPSGPIRLVGYSFGGLVAFEMARQLSAQGRTPEHLTMLDVRPPRASLTRPERIQRKVGNVAAAFIPMFRENTPGRSLRNRFSKKLPADRVAMRGGFGVFNGYLWGPYDGDVTYCLARRRLPVVMNLLHAWRRVAPRLTVVKVPGAHHDLLHAEHAPILGRTLSEALPT
jgi:acetoacetyl-CoA synthetase